MEKNLMTNVAGLLGLSLHEPFKIRNDDGELIEGIFEITPSGVRDTTGFYESDFLTFLVSGDFKVEKIRWQPKEGETFFSYQDICKGQEWAIAAEQWHGFPYQYALLATNMVFRTEQAALLARPKVYQKLTGKEWRDKNAV